MKGLILFLCLCCAALALFPVGIWQLEGIHPGSVYESGATTFTNVAVTYNISSDNTFAGLLTATYAGQSSTILLSGGAWSLSNYSQPQIPLLTIGFSQGVSCALVSGSYNPCPLAGGMVRYMAGIFFNYNITTCGQTGLALCYSQYLKGAYVWDLISKAGDCAIFS